MTTFPIAGSRAHVTVAGSPMSAESQLTINHKNDAFMVETERLTRGVRYALDAMDSVLGVIPLRGTAHSPGKQQDFILYQVFMDRRTVKCGIETAERHPQVQHARKTLADAGFPATAVAIDNHDNTVITFWLRPGRRGPEAWGPAS